MYLENYDDVDYYIIAVETITPNVQVYKLVTI